MLPRSEAANVSPTLEASLLASDEEERRSCEESSDRENQESLRIVPPPPPPPSCDFYQDRARDTGNLRVSTLYYPGRPNYSWRDELTLGSVCNRRERRKRRLKRYYETAAIPPPADLDEVATRSATYRRMLTDTPTDVDLWLRYIRFQECCRGGGAALETATEACVALPARALRDARLTLARTHLPSSDYLTMLRDMLANEKSVAVRCELWACLVEGVSSSASSCTAEGVRDVTRAALRDTQHHAPAYPRLLYAYGSFLRAAGLWESLVLVIELVASMSFPPSAAFPPPSPTAQVEAEAERALAEAEATVERSGLPLAARWARVERERAAVHWRPARGLTHQDLQADPQRAPLAGDVCDVVCAGGAAPLALAATLLTLAKVPVLPGGAWGRMECAEGALVALRAARRLPPAHPARRHAPAAPDLLAMLVDPPHYFTCRHGYRDWVEALWEACCGWVTGAARVALVCWRLRWMHTLLLLNPPKDESSRVEAQRLRSSARKVLRAWGGDSPLPFLQFARIEAAVNGPQAGVQTCMHAMRAALRGGCDVTRLYAARLLRELEGGLHGERVGQWALVCAVLRHPLPADEHLQHAPPEELVLQARQACLQRCHELELEFASSTPARHVGGGGDEEMLTCLLPGAGEWGAARVHLSTPDENTRLYQRMCDMPPTHHTDGCARARYWEQCACALVCDAHAHARAGPWAHALAPHAPHNAYLALCRAGAGEWARRRRMDAGLEGAGRTEAAAWGSLLPALLPALDGGGAEAGRRAASAARRGAARGGGGAVFYSAALELAARDTGGTLAPQTILYEALDAHPQHKWLYVRGSCWSGAGASLADLLLERRLRLHALPLELHQPGADHHDNQ